jgi:hypothetical protein
MIYIGIDDTDTLGGLGTKRLARLIVADLSADYRCALILRHQLLFDPRVPYTSKNSACSILLEAESVADAILDDVVDRVQAGILARFQEGSDPGLCVTASVPDAVVGFGLRCQREVVAQPAARALAVRHGIRLEGLGGTADGVIGALAAVGLAVTGNDGRVLQVRGIAEELSGWQPLGKLAEYGVDEVRCCDLERPVTDGEVDVGKRLRPNYRTGRVVLYVEPEAVSAVSQNRWRAVRFA